MSGKPQWCTFGLYSKILLKLASHPEILSFQNSQTHKNWKLMDLLIFHSEPLNIWFRVVSPSISRQNAFDLLFCSVVLCCRSTEVKDSPPVIQGVGRACVCPKYLVPKENFCKSFKVQEENLVKTYRWYLEPALIRIWFRPKIMLKTFQFITSLRCLRASHLRGSTRVANCVNFLLLEPMHVLHFVVSKPLKILYRKSKRPFFSV